MLHVHLELVDLLIKFRHPFHKEFYPFHVVAVSAGEFDHSLTESHPIFDVWYPCTA